MRNYILLIPIPFFKFILYFFKKNPWSERTQQTFQAAYSGHSSERK